ncbi:erythromycin esterase [Thermosporothrix hazakensis]|jgi:erythromycin esterase|uniref:Erythromycin esterase n=1 Tax=Thermosporothrix hazakensis TaxID=644383 RepID=A0A326U9S4_THEHA|nr:erythromycin esterase [Thermosporothrix hazakensis]GCE45423.1 hypothetical protein KTH_02920 [Thermosporothrix hazakensis]
MSVPCIPRKSLFLGLLGALLLLAGSLTQPVSAVGNPVEHWLSTHARPLHTTNPEGSLDDLNVLRGMVANASIVGLGEATHGTHEFFTLKHRLVRFLVEKMGFTTLAMEENWNNALNINEYVLYGKGDPKALVRSLERPWRTQEVLELVTWLRAYNADPRHTQKVRFAGIDVQGLDTHVFDLVIEYVAAKMPAQLHTVVSLYNGFRTCLSEVQNRPACLSDPEALQTYRGHARTVENLLQQQP